MHRTTQNYQPKGGGDPNACNICGKTGHWARECWQRNNAFNSAPMDIGFVWDESTETYWVYDEEGEEEWPEEEGGE